MKDAAIDTLKDLNIRNLRDSLMADNINWLAKELYPNEKIIIWSASYHNARHKTIGYGDGKETLMGDFLSQSFQNSIYSICFTAYEGYAAWYNRKDSTPLEKPFTNSFEDLFYKTGFDNIFLDFKTLSKTNEGQWLTIPRVMRPLGYVNQEKNWTLVFDAVIFNRSMRKAHSIFDKK